MITQVGQGELRNNRPDVDREVVPEECRATQSGLAGALFVIRQAHEGGDIRLDYAATAGKQHQSNHQRKVVLNAQDEMSQNIGDCEPDDRPILAEEAISEKATQERQKVTSCLEG